MTVLNEDGFEVEVITGSRTPGLSRPGGSNPNASLTNGQARELRELRAVGHWSHGDLAWWFGISVARSSEICKGHAYKDAGGPVEPPGRVYNRSATRAGEDREKLAQSVLELRRAGLSQRAIATRIGKSKWLVGEVLREHGAAA